jgi:hypothetical protein
VTALAVAQTASPRKTPASGVGVPVACQFQLDPKGVGDVAFPVSLENGPGGAETPRGPAPKGVTFDARSS